MQSSAFKWYIIYMVLLISRDLFSLEAKKMSARLESTVICSLGIWLYCRIMKEIFEKKLCSTEFQSCSWIYYTIQLKNILHTRYLTRDTEIDETVLHMPHQFKTKNYRLYCFAIILPQVLWVHNTSVDSCFPFISYNNDLIWQFFWRLAAFDPQCQISGQMKRGFLISMLHPWCGVMMPHYPHTPFWVFLRRGRNIFSSWVQVEWLRNNLCNWAIFAKVCFIVITAINNTLKL